MTSNFKISLPLGVCIKILKHVFSDVDSAHRSSAHTMIIRKDRTAHGYRSPHLAEISR